MKQLIMIVGLLLAVCLLVPVACAKAPAPMPAPAPAPPAPEVILPPGEGVVYKETGAGALPSTAEERMIVRNGDISLVVTDVVVAMDEIAQLAARLDGYVVSTRISGEEQDMRGWISIRVPDERFDQALAELRELAVRVESERTSSRDVTEEYIDLESRLRNAEATESQYLTLLQEAKVEEAIRIYELLHQVRGEIEQIKGRMRYLERTSSMSLIEVRLEPEATAKPLVRAGWSALEALKSAVRGIVIFGQWLGTAAIWLVIFIPVWGTILGVVLWRLRKRRILRSKS